MSPRISRQQLLACRTAFGILAVCIAGSCGNSRVAASICVLRDGISLGGGVLVKGRIRDWSPETARSQQLANQNVEVTPITLEVVEVLSSNADGGTPQQPSGVVVVGRVQQSGASDVGDLSRAKDVDSYLFIKQDSGVSVVFSGAFFWRQGDQLFNNDAYADFGVLEADFLTVVETLGVEECGLADLAARNRSGNLSRDGGT